MTANAAQSLNLTQPYLSSNMDANNRFSQLLPLPPTTNAPSSTSYNLLLSQKNEEMKDQWLPATIDPAAIVVCTDNNAPQHQPPIGNPLWVIATPGKDAKGH